MTTNEEDKGWNNHEDTFEESLRRELVAARATIFLLQKDLEELTKAYYTVLDEKYKRNLQ
jgi:hypothetical protein|tara:strand:- start:1466 stop:1645 length:180 start_codon:yes stop_codon:yes gene_type:complete